MHQYLQTLGFETSLKRSDEKMLIDRLIANASQTIRFSHNNGSQLVIYVNEIAKHAGVVVLGYETEGKFELEHYYPYIDTDILTTKENCLFSKEYDKERYLASCEDAHFGLTTIFSLLNIPVVYKNKLPLEKSVPVTGVYLAGLALEAKILLPIEKTLEEEYNTKEKDKLRTKLIKEAQDGNDEAIERLTRMEMTTFHAINHRVFDSDLYSVVDTFFMPSGVLSDKYSLMGEIVGIKEEINPYTKQHFYIMDVIANDINMSVAVSANNLVGYPELHRRIKCEVWLQGRITVK